MALVAAGAFTGLLHTHMPPGLTLETLGNYPDFVWLILFGTVLLALSWLALTLLYRQHKALARFEKAAKRIVRRDMSLPYQGMGRQDFPGLVNVVNELVGQLDASMDAQRSLSEIDSLILSGAEMTAIIRRCLIAANLDALETRLLLRPDMTSVAVIMHKLQGMKVITQEMPLLETSVDALGYIDLYRRLAEEQSERVLDCFPIACDEQLVGVLFAAGHRTMNALEAKRLTDLVDRLSVAMTNINRSETLYQQAHFDPLTGLLNRRAFEDRLKESLTRSRRDETGVLLFIDLDGFKKVNDTEGHEAGDKLLAVVADRLRSAVRPEDIIARLGGDEFAIIAPGPSDEAAVTAICERILRSVPGPVVVDRMEHTIGTSIGVARYPEDGQDLDEVLMKADSAMYRAKESGGTQFAFFDDHLKEANDHRILVESRLRNAVKQRDLELYFQPKLKLDSWTLSSSEALLRWNDEQLGNVSPGDFIGVAEDTGLIHSFMPIIVDGATSVIHEMEQRGLHIETVALNASPKQIMTDGFALSVLSMLDMRNIPHEMIEMEVTESVFAQDMAQVLTELHILRMAGIKIALDDFGTGYSSLNMLRELPLDTVKIDQAFIVELETSDEARSMLKHLIDIAKVLGLQVVAEGVETEVQLQYLMDHGCDVVQGFLISKALPENEYLDMIASWNPQRPAEALAGSVMQVH